MNQALELRVPPPFVALVAAGGMWLLSGFTPLFQPSELWRIVIAMGLALSGIAAAVSGVFAFRRSRTTIHPHRPDRTSALVDTGIFRFSRNPMYLGMALVLLAWSVWLGGPLTLLGPVLFMTYIQRFQIRPEERALEELFGERFSSYRQRVRRWL